MILEEEHPLLWQAKLVRCKEGHETPLYTTDHGYCGCGGWELWARTREEIKAAHRHHLSYCEGESLGEQGMAKQTKPAQRLDLRGVPESLHELKWVDASTAYCHACNWKLGSLSRATIQRAYEAHLLHARAY